MGWLQTLLGGGDSVKAIGDAVDKLFTSDYERLERENEKAKAEQNFNLELAKLDAQLAQGQIDVNKVEAASTSLFVSGWRPALGWVGAIALAYKYILYPFMCWVLLYYPDAHLPPASNAGELYPLIMGMLGLGGFRTYEKVKGVAAK
jgi:hypothetical protein